MHICSATSNYRRPVFHILTFPSKLNGFQLFHKSILIVFVHELYIFSRKWVIDQKKVDNAVPTLTY